MAVRILVPAVLGLALLLSVGCPDEAPIGDDDTVPGDDDSADTPDDKDGDGWFADDDCDDTDPTVNPDAEEVCDGKDTDCSGDTPESEQDSDGDGWLLCAGDCEPEDSAIYPGAEEVCDLVDNDCDADTPAEQHCNPRPLDTADATLLGEDWWDEFGHDLTFVGDVNADGFDDILVGATSNDHYWQGYGYCVLCYGPCSGVVPVDEVDVVFQANSITHDYTGWFVSAAGDTNADGYDDILMRADEGTSLFLGPIEAGEHDADDGDAFFVGLGSRYAAMGDTNGDGFADVLMSADWTTMAALFLGPQSGDVDLSMADAWIVEDSWVSNPGAVVARAGDTNSDGQVDYLIGIPQEDGAAGAEGAAYVINGPIVGETSLIDSAEVIVYGEAYSEQFGIRVAGAGDMNGDGYDDILVGSGHGRAHLFLSPLSGTMMAADADTVFEGEPGYIHSEAPAGDYDGDGFNDLLFGLPHWQEGNRAYLYFGPFDTGDVLVSDLLVGDSAHAFYFHGSAGDIAVTPPGDADGDGMPDILIGGEGIGEAFLFYGNLL